MSALGHKQPVSSLALQWLQWVGSGYRQLQEANFRFCPQSGYTIGVIFSDAYSSKRPKAVICILQN